MLRIALLATGDKGYNAAHDLAQRYQITTLVTYPQTNSVRRLDDFVKLANAYQIDLVVTRQPDLSIEADLIFTVGWQNLIGTECGNLVVLHDSLLPKFRGFAPTVAALLVGETRLGVTAFVPTSEVDVGPILAQSSCEISYPISIQAAFERLRQCYVDVVDRVCEDYSRKGRLIGTTQDETAATYSLWRDPFDYAIDWSMDATKVLRHIHASGEPYDGALTATFDGRLFRVLEAKAARDIPLVERDPGKVLSRADGNLVVVCGAGCVEIGTPIALDGGPFPEGRLRIRFTPQTVTQQFLAAGER